MLSNLVKSNFMKIYLSFVDHWLWYVTQNNLNTFIHCMFRNHFELFRNHFNYFEVHVEKYRDCFVLSLKPVFYVGK